MCPGSTSSSYAVCAPRRAFRSVPLSDSRHRDLYPLRLLHGQLCRLCPSNFPLFVPTAIHLARPQTVIVVVLLAMDFWNCRVRLEVRTERTFIPLIH